MTRTYRRAKNNSDSLDMLLDAISNTFGGVLFIAVLVVILLQFTGESQKDDRSVADESPQQTEIQRLTKEIQERESAVAGLATPSHLRVAQEVIFLNKEALRLMGQLGPTESNNEESERLRRERYRSATLLSELRRKVREATAAQQRSAKLPKLRETDKSEFPMMVSADRVHWLYTPRQDGSLGPPRLQAFVPAPANKKLKNAGVVIDHPQGGGPFLAQPKSGSGIALTTTKEVITGLKSALRRLDPKKSYLAIAVWEDSFDTFGHLRNAVVDMGFEYRLIPMKAGSHVGSGGAGSVLVQ